jgi:hypothetical protein
MTPQEKAEELFDKYNKTVNTITNTPIKKCALIAVDEVIEALHEHHWQNRLIIDYWEEVKHKIENYG